MKILTLEQERDLIKSFIDRDFEDNGAARMVFYRDKTTDAILKDILTEDEILHGYVIKICFGADGWNQSKHEIEFYREHGNCGSLAKIFAYGSICEIMEYVTDCRELADELFSEFYEEVDYCGSCDYEDQCDIFSDCYNTQDAEEYEDYNEMFSVLVDLNGITGFSSDNLQIGKNMDGKIVAYDYGFEEDSCDCQCSSYCDSISYGANINAFLKLVIEMLDEMIEFNSRSDLHEHLLDLDDRIYNELLH